MKLCKDCKHAVWPIPGEFFVSVSGLRMCGHPDAPREFVEGAPTARCRDARLDEQFCGQEARLFEERPPKPQIVYFSEPMDPSNWGSLTNGSSGTEAAKPWWRRMFGG